MVFLRQEYKSGLPSSMPEDFPSPGIEPMSLAPPAFAGRFFYHLASRFFTIIACWEDPFFDHSKSKVKIRRQLKWSSTYWKTITGKLGCYARQEYLSSKNKVISYLNKIWGSFPPTGIHWKKRRRRDPQCKRVRCKKEEEKVLRVNWESCFSVLYWMS